VIVGSVQAVGSRAICLRLAAYAGVVAMRACVLLSVALGFAGGLCCGADAGLVALAAAALGAVMAARRPGVCKFARCDSTAMGQRAPLASAAITAGALSLMGAPLTIGFLGRWRLVEAGVGAGWWWAAGAGDHRVARRRVLWRPLDRAHVFPPRQRGV
jgi:NADH:ubiquinone oxidoreductase subunit 2 (subunit N)